MNKAKKFGIAFIGMICFGGFMAYQDHLEAEKFSAEGIITEAKWNTSNHQMSLFMIKGNGGAKKLHHQRVTLTPEQIKVGDSFKKESGAKVCNINGKDIPCIK